MARRTVRCPLCKRAGRPLYKAVDGFDYHECGECDFIFIAPEVLDRIDAGQPVRLYDRAYWRMELASAKERSWGPSLARVAEVLLYCRIPVESFVDIGTGPGYLLDALSWALPSSRHVFWGCEAFPPPAKDRTRHPNYLVGTLGASTRQFQSGCCMEVIEHLTPAMARGLAAEMAAVSAPGACYIVNTGLTQYVRHEDAAYLDPTRRGHITIWSVPAARLVFEPLGFVVHPLPGKTWAFVLEYRPVQADPSASIMDRIWSPCPKNLKILKDEQTGSLLYVLGIDTARAYY